MSGCRAQLVHMVVLGRHHLLEQLSALHICCCNDHLMKRQAMISTFAVATTATAWCRLSQCHTIRCDIQLIKAATAEKAMPAQIV